MLEDYVERRDQIATELADNTLGSCERRLLINLHKIASSGAMRVISEIEDLEDEIGSQRAAGKVVVDLPALLHVYHQLANFLLLFLDQLSIFK